MAASNSVRVSVAKPMATPKRPAHTARSGLTQPAPLRHEREHGWQWLRFALASKFRIEMPKRLPLRALALPGPNVEDMVEP